MRSCRPTWRRFGPQPNVGGGWGSLRSDLSHPAVWRVEEFARGAQTLNVVINIWPSGIGLARKSGVALFIRKGSELRAPPCQRDVSLSTVPGGSVAPSSNLFHEFQLQPEGARDGL